MLPFLLVACSLLINLKFGVASERKIKSGMPNPTLIIDSAVIHIGLNEIFLLITHPTVISITNLSKYQ